MAIELYKPEGAKTSRGLTAFCLGALLLYGSLSLYEYLADGWWMDPFGGENGWGEILGEEFPLAPRTLLTLGLMAVSGFGIFYLCNLPKYVDFLCETEAELKKVTWPSRPEVYSSSVIVIITTLILAAYIWVVDNIFIWIKFNIDPTTWFS
jgi:preprotein translocase SecE subunit